MVVFFSQLSWNQVKRHFLHCTPIYLQDSIRVLHTLGSSILPLLSLEGGLKGADREPVEEDGASKRYSFWVRAKKILQERIDFGL